MLTWQISLLLQHVYTQSLFHFFLHIGLCDPGLSLWPRHSQWHCDMVYSTELYTPPCFEDLCFPFSFQNPSSAYFFWIFGWWWNSKFTPSISYINCLWPSSKLIFLMVIQGKTVIDIIIIILEFLRTVGLIIFTVFSKCRVSFSARLVLTVAGFRLFPRKQSIKCLQCTCGLWKPSQGGVLGKHTIH